MSKYLDILANATDMVMLHRKLRDDIQLLQRSLDGSEVLDKVSSIGRRLESSRLDIEEIRNTAERLNQLVNSQPETFCCRQKDCD